MPSNAQIRSVQFAQGVEVSLPDDVVSLNENVPLDNNVTDEPTGVVVDINVYRELIFDYSIRRRTDSTTGLIERGRMRITTNPDGLTDADKFILSFDFKNDEGVSPGVTFTLDTSVPDEATLLYTTTNLAGANHECIFSYFLTPLTE